MPYLPYEEPGITTILSLTSFLLLLNAIRYVFDQLIYCGLIGEILIGIIWGLPIGGTAWLSLGTQEAIQAFGYLGLIGLVFEGGLSTDIALLRQNAYASVSVATIGLLMPIGLSFLLLVFPFTTSAGTAYPTPLAAFSAGASLCSTSLGTTFAILSAANMQNTRVGVVLVGAAMMDDVVGLVMVNIVTTLGKGDSGGWSIARPIVASFGLLLVTLALCSYVLRPVWSWLVGSVTRNAQGSRENMNPVVRTMTKLVLRIPHLQLVMSTLVLLALVTIASFIDASVLFAAFIAGGIVSFLWPVGIIEQQLEQHRLDATCQDQGPVEMYEKYFKSAMDYILVPFFFASIGFSIPITDMFTGSIVWKGVVYAILMIVAKGLVSIVLYFECFLKGWKHKPLQNPIQLRTSPQQSTAPRSETLASPELSTDSPHSDALLVGLAMVARGEIGFLIASLSQSSGTLTLRIEKSGTTVSSGKEIFLVIVWAVVICTIVGPLGVGIIVKRARA